MPDALIMKVLQWVLKLHREPLLRQMWTLGSLSSSDQAADGQKLMGELWLEEPGPTVHPASSSLLPPLDLLSHGSWLHTSSTIRQKRHWQQTYQGLNPGSATNLGYMI